VPFQSGFEINENESTEAVRKDCKRAVVDEIVGVYICTEYKIKVGPIFVTPQVGE